MKSHPKVEILSSYLDAELAPPTSRRLEVHLQECTDCRRRLWGLRRVAQRLGEMERMGAPEGLGDEIRRRAALEAGRRGPLRRSGRAGFERFTLESSLLPAFAVMLALVLIGYLLSWGVQQRRPTEAPVAHGSEDGEAAESQERPGPQVAPPEVPVESAAPTASERDAAAGPPAAPAIRSGAGRVFERRGEVWIERGLDSSSAVTQLQFGDPVVQKWMVDHPQLLELRRLGGPVRLRLRGEIVEIVFPSP